MNKKNRRGVTLVEVMISVVIIMLVGGAVIQFLTLNSKETVTLINRIQANQYLDQISTHLRLKNLSKEELHLTQFPQIITDPKFTADVSVSKLTPNLPREIRIRIEWSSLGTPLSLESVETLAPR